METRTVEYSDDEYEIRLVVRKATSLTGMKKSIMTRNNLRWLRKRYASGNGADEEKFSPLPAPVSVDDEAERFILQRVMPDLLSCVVEVEGLDLDTMTPELFFDLPDEFTDAWEVAVYSLNRHWLGLPKLKGDEDEDEDPKEQETSDNSIPDES